MKKTVTFLLVIVFAIPILWAQNSDFINLEPTVHKPTNFSVSPPLRDIPIELNIPKDTATRNPDLRVRNYPFAATALPQGPDEAWQKEMGTSDDIKAPMINFQGLIQTGVGRPPDTQGDVGPDHYFQVVNTRYQIFNKVGTSLAGPNNISTIWTSMGITVGSISDPIVIYDEQADRWFISIFKTTSPYEIYVAVSQTADPTGAWYGWEYSWSTKPDYAKYGVWRDGYYYASNTTGQDVGVFDRAAMISGNASPDLVTFDNPNRPNPGVFHSLMPLDNDGTFANSGTEGQFITINDDAWNGGSDQLWIYELDVNWVPNPPTASFSRTQTINVAAFDANFGPNWDNIAQPGTAQELDAVPEVLMYRAQYRNFGTHQSIVCCHSVDVDNTDHAGVRWYELRRTTGNWYVRQQSTYSPDADSRWMGSIAMNGLGDIALGYSVSSSSVYPSIRYTGRKAGDALNLMTMTEESIFEGSNSQTGSNRWGDYSMMSVDPENDVIFWYTNEYSAGGLNWRTQIANFSFSSSCFASGGCFEYIQTVECGDIDNSTDCTEYGDYTDQSTNIPLNAVEELTVTIGSPYSGDDITVWVDWNRDGDFYDANEEIGYLTGVGPHTFTIDPPAGATTGECTMRIRLSWDGSPPSSPCGTTNYGEVEDYTINITSAAINYWIGVTSTDWTTASNWSLGTVPDAISPVRINAGTPFQCIIGDGVTANAKNIFLVSGSTLTQNSQSWFYVYGSFDAGFGQFTMNGTTSYLYLRGSSDSYWYDDYQDDTYNTVVIWKDVASAEVIMQQDMTIGNVFQVYSGIFSPNNSVITCTLTSGSGFYMNSGGSVVLDSSSDGVTAAGSIQFYNGSQAHISNGTIHCGGDLDIYANATWDHIITGGTIIMNGSGEQQINNQEGADFHVHNLTIDKPGGTCYLESGDLHIVGDLLISDGTLSCDNGPSPTATYDIKIEGDWTNNVGTDGFDESTGRVTFFQPLSDGGKGHQYVSNEEFNILEISKWDGGALRLSGTIVTCNSYDWTYGALDVLTGTFTALDLFDNGLYGYFYTNPGGYIHLHQGTGSGEYVDLNGHLIFSGGGEIHVYGGSLTSYWPFYANASLTMNGGGVLDFHDRGIYVYDDPDQTFTATIDNGTIRTGVGFQSNRADFTPSSGVVEFYGETTGYLSLTNGSTLNNVVVNKSAKDGTAKSATGPVVDPRSGEMISDGTRATLVNLNSNATITNDLTIEAGSLDLNGYVLDVGNDVIVNNGTLVMEDPADVLNLGHQISWNAGSTANITNGEINLQMYFHIYDGSNVQIGTGNTLNMVGTYETSIHNFSPIAELGNVNVFMPSGNSYVHSGSTEPVHIIGDMTIQADNHFRVQRYELIVDGVLDLQPGALMDLGSSFGSGYLESNGELILSGTLELDYDDGFDNSKSGNISEASDLYGKSGSGRGTRTWYPGEVLVHGDFSSNGSGVLNILGGGSFIWDEPFGSGFSTLYGSLNLDDGLFEATDKSIQLIGVANVNGGLIRIGRTFRCTTVGSFLPTAGTVELKGPDAGHYILVNSGNYFYHLDIDRDMPIGLHTGSDLVVQENLTINGGGLNSYSQSIFIGGDWMNNVGPDAFSEGTGTVTFNGDWGQECSTEEFYNLVLNKPTGDLQLFNGQDVSCQVYQWLDGEIHVAVGTFTAYDLYDNGIFGDYFVSGIDATVNLYQDASGWVDLNGSIAINNGEMNIHGGSGSSFWPFAGNAELILSGGVLDFHDRNIYLNGASTYTLTTNITGGIIRTNGSFHGESPDFTPSGGTVGLTGDITASAGFTGGSHFHNLHIDKTAAKDNGFEALNYTDRNGKEIVKSRAALVNAAYDFAIEGDLTIDAGTFSLNGHEVNAKDDVYVNDGGILNVDQNAQLLLSGSSIVNVHNGGRAEFLGTTGNEAVLSHSTGYYDFNVLGGGTIAAEHAIFEYMGTVQGIHVANAGLVDVANSFNYCTFRNGNGALVNEALLTIDNAQDFTVNYASFPTSGTNYNVAKTLNQGRVTFKDFSGIFSGEAFDLDNYNRIDWFVPQLSVNPTSISVLPPAGTTSFDITSNVDWTVSESLSWLSVSPATGSNNKTVTINYTQNSSAAPRSGIITVSGVDVPNVTVTITQAGATLSVMPAVQNVAAIAGSTTFNVSSNTTWSVNESVSWFSITPMSGTGNAGLTVNYSANTSVTPRSGTFTVSTPGLPVVTLTVNQAGAGAILTVAPTNRNVTPPAGSTTFAITSNTGWTVSESVAWLNVLPMSGSGNGTLNVSYGENATGSIRVGNITVTATGGAPSQTITVTQASYPTHSISLSEGWSGLSSYIMPVNNDIEDVFSPVSGSFVITQTMTQMYYPAGPVNTIIDWASQSAYKLKMDAAATLPIIGNSETNKTLSMGAGWNLIPVICNYSVDAASTLGSLDLEIAKDVAGVGVLWPDLSINTLGNLTPGMAYYILLNSGGSFTYPPNSAESIPADPVVMKIPEHPWNSLESSSSSHIIAIVAEGMQEIHAGDIIGVFAPNGKCYGVSEVVSDEQNIALSAFANDLTTDTKDGFNEGEPFSFELYRPESNVVCDLEVVFNPDMPNGMFFANEGLSAISNLKISSTGIGGVSASGISIYPNPTNDKVWISGIVEFSEIEVLSNTGKLLLQHSNEGKHETSIDISSLSSGIYQLRLSGDKTTVIRKIIKN